MWDREELKDVVHSNVIEGGARSKGLMSGLEVFGKHPDAEALFQPHETERFGEGAGNVKHLIVVCSRNPDDSVSGVNSLPGVQAGLDEGSFGLVGENGANSRQRDPDEGHEGSSFCGLGALAVEGHEGPAPNFHDDLIELLINGRVGEFAFTMGSIETLGIPAKLERWGEPDQLTNGSLCEGVPLIEQVPIDLNPKNLSVYHFWLGHDVSRLATDCNVAVKWHHEATQTHLCLGTEQGRSEGQFRP